MNSDIEPTADPEDAQMTPQRPAWQPLTPKGVAAFARAPIFRLLAVEFVVSILAALSLFWFIKTAWIPPIQQGMEKLPDGSALIDGRLIWPDRTPLIMGENRFLSIAVDPDDTDQTDQSSDFKLEFGEREIRLVGCLGTWTLVYPKLLRISLSPTEVIPWWGAWKQAGLALVFILTPLFVYIIWTCLGLLYSPLAKYLATFGDRSLSWYGAYKLCSAALMPGALLMSASIVLYGLAQIDFLRLGFLMIFHLIVGWIYLVISVLCLPKDLSEARSDNPFASNAEEASDPNQPQNKDNPFAS